MGPMGIRDILLAMIGKIFWGDTYLGVHVTTGLKFCCSVSNGKRSFYRAFNCIFDKVCRVAYENVVIELLKARCIPSLY